MNMNMKQSIHMKSSITITNPPTYLYPLTNIPSSTYNPIYLPLSSSSHHSNYTSRKRAFSLPKTQPTKNSSYHRLSHQNMEQIQQIQTCPEISEFKSLDNSMYIHKMNIDYGHLEEPVYWPRRMVNIDGGNQIGKFGVQKQIQKVNDGNLKMSIVRQIDEIPEQRGFQDIGIIKSVKAKAKSKSMIKLSRNNNTHNQSSPNIQQQHQQTKRPSQQQNQYQIFTQQNDIKNTSKKLNTSLVSNSDSKLKQNKIPNTTTKFNYNHIIDKNSPKLKQVLAAKMLSNQSPIIKHLSQQSTYRNTNRNTQQKTQRRVPHCRIVKTYVGGNKMQVKIISYPDNSQYMKLCGHGKNL